MTELTHAFAGLAYPAQPSEGRWPGYQHEPEVEPISGAFRVVEDEGVLVVVGNGEDPEKFWKVAADEWNEWAALATPEFVEQIEDPIIRAGLRRQIGDMRALAARAGKVDVTCDGSGYLHRWEDATTVYREGRCSGCLRCLPLREIEVLGWSSVLDPIPGVARVDVIAYRQRFSLRRLRWERPKALIVDQRFAALSTWGSS